MKTAAFALLLFSSLAFAMPNGSPAPLSLYHCRVAYVSDASDIPTHEFDPVEGASVHGGEEISFKVGSEDVTVQANHVWMNVLWERQGKTVAKVITAVDPSVFQPSRALMIFNPQDDSQQIQFSCDKK